MTLAAIDFFHVVAAAGLADGIGAFDRLRVALTISRRDAFPTSQRAWRGQQGAISSHWASVKSEG